jgi:hypothetical protein
MPLPLVALPLASGALQAGGAIARGVGASRAAKALFPEEYAKRQEQLQAEIDAGQAGLTDVQRMGMEADVAAQVAGQSADAQAANRQLQQSMAGSGAVNAATLFAQDVARQQMNQDAIAQGQRLIAEENAREEERKRQELNQLAAQEAEKEAALRQARATVVADVLGAAGQAAVGAIGSQQMTSATDAFLNAQTSQARQAAMSKMYTAQFAMQAAGAFGGRPAPMPMAPTVAPTAASTAASTVPPATTAQPNLLTLYGQQQTLAPGVPVGTDPFGNPIDAYGNVITNQFGY